jgi:hypothetical protein
MGSVSLFSHSKVNQTLNRELVVEVNLKDPKFAPGKKVFDRVKWCFDNNLSESFHFQLAYVNKGRIDSFIAFGIVKQSLADGESLPLPESILSTVFGQSNTEQKHLNAVERVYASHPVPLMEKVLGSPVAAKKDHLRTFEEQQQVQDYLDTYEWLGMMHLPSQR